ncbi:MAG: branched-chain amino acid ABC transporter permease [Pseudomonadota bacterium]
MAETPAYAVSRATRSSRIGMAIGLVVLIILATAPWWAGRADLRLLIEIFYYLALAQLWNLLAGYTGLVSVGQQAFVGLGGYTLFALAAFGGVNPLAAIALAGVVAAIFALPTAFLVFRLRGAYFAIGTWVVAEVYRLGFAQVSALGGGSGMSLPADVVRSIADGRQAREWLVYWVALIIVLAAMAIVYALLRSRQGLALTAIRDSEPASESLGVNTYRTKLVIYIAVAFATGLVGALIFLQKLRISPDAAFSVNDWTAFVIFIVVIGGIGRIEGPIIGVIVFFVLRELFVDFGAWYLMLLGAVAVVIMLLAPRGLWGLLTDRWDIQLFPVRRALVVKETKDSG